MKRKYSLLLAIGLGLTLAAVWLLTLSGFGAPEARAASFTVCATGCDYSVIQDAVDAASNGDVIKVAAGTYDERLVIDKRLSFIGSGSDSTIVQPTYAPSAGQYDVQIDASGVVIQDFQFDFNGADDLRAASQ